MDPKSPLASPMLIVDDEPEIRSFVQRLAESVGFRTVAAANAGEALAKLPEIAPTAVVMDMQMPEGDGIQLLQGLAALQTRPRVVILSGADTRTLEITGEIARQRGLDVAAILQKPVRAADLRQHLAAIYAEAQPFSSATLRTALDGGMVNLHYQPKIRLLDAKFIGVEALLRCTDGAGRPVSPENVIAIAEGSGMIGELNDYIFRSAIEQRRSWSERSMDLDIAVNLPARSSFETELPDRLVSLCSQHNVPHQAVTIEMTESGLTDERLMVMETMVRLRLVGFRLSIDDFGTGHSSLIRLRQLPFTELKIDKLFVTTLQESSENAIIVKTIISLAQNLGMRSVIEGVEDQFALSFATGFGCDEAQGYHIARPMAAVEIEEFAKTWQWRRSSLDSKTEHARSSTSESTPVPKNC